jgi:hypothetical protein
VVSPFENEQGTDRARSQPTITCVKAEEVAGIRRNPMDLCAGGLDFGGGSASIRAPNDNDSHLTCNLDAALSWAHGGH